MKITLDIADYDTNGIDYQWESGFEIRTNIIDGQILISANKGGLISLAKQLLALAQKDIPVGHHFHYDENNSLEYGSAELIIEKL